MTAEEMLESAQELEFLASRKVRQSEQFWAVACADQLRHDAATMLEEAESLRRKAERLTEGAP